MEQPPDDQQENTLDRRPDEILVSISNTGGEEDESSNQLRFSTLRRLWELCGFEIETDFQIQRHDDLLVYGETIFTAPSGLWWINTDGVDDGSSGVLEFVLRAQQEWDDLSPVIDEIVTFVCAAQERLMQGDCSFAELLAYGNLPPPSVRAKCNVTVNPTVDRERGCRGAPQVTMGVPLHRLAEVLLLARDFHLDEFELQIARDRVLAYARRNELTPTPEELDDAAKLRRKHDPRCGLVLPQSVLFKNDTVRDGVELAIEWGRRMRENAPRNVRSVDIDRAVGLMAMILRYLNEGFYGPNVASYAKGIFAVMARTHFAAMYKALGTAQALFDEQILQVLGEWSEGSDLSKMRVCRRGFSDLKLEREVGGKRVEEGHRTRFGGMGQGGGRVTFHGPSISDWIGSISKPGDYGSKDDKELDQRLREIHESNKSIARNLSTLSGKDLMSRGTVAFNSVSMGLFDIRSIEKVPFVVVEFRQWPSWSIEPRYWKRLLGRVWSFFNSTCWALVERDSVDLSSVDEIGVYGAVDQDLLMRLGELGWSTGSGECLFESVLASGLLAEESPGTPHTTRRLRQLVAQELRTNWVNYIEFLPNDVELGDDMRAIVENAANYLERPGNWARAVADLAPVALSRAIGHPFLISMPDGRLELVGRDGSGETIPLQYNGIDHYDPG